MYSIMINYEEFSFRHFQDAVDKLETEYGFSGSFWDITTASDDFEMLINFLMEEGFHVDWDF